MVPNTNLVSLKMEADIDIPLFNICALVYEVELFNHFVPFCKRTLTVKKIAKAHKVAYLAVDLPIISNRES